jgi:phosphate transport system permease protein
MVLANPDLVGQTVRFEVLAGGRIDGYFKGRVTMATAERDKQRDARAAGAGRCAGRAG